MTRLVYGNLILDRHVATLARSFALKGAKDVYVFFNWVRYGVFHPEKPIRRPRRPKRIRVILRCGPKNAS